MLGGKLNTTGLYQSSDQNIVLLAFSNSIYLFSKKEATVLNKFSEHESPIVSFICCQSRKQLFSLDSDGVLISWSFQVKQQQFTLTVKNKAKMLTEKEQAKIKSAIFLMEQQEFFAVYFVTSTKQLFHYTEGWKKPKNVGEYAQIGGVFASRLVLFTKESKGQFIVLDRQSYQILYKHRGDSIIQSMSVIRGTSLVFGDDKGKIWILQGVLNRGKVMQTMKLEWHLHSVFSLTAEGNYLYSGGQQGTVVLWHLKQNTKDFLPRVGTSIMNLIVNGSEIYCFLSDNTVKMIELNEDKKVTEFKLLVDPHGYKTTQTVKSAYLAYQDKPKKFSNIHYNKTRETICLNSLPGKLQFFHLPSARNEQVSISKRNFISRLDDSYPNPYQIVSTALNENWTEMAVAMEGFNHSSLNFYRYEAYQDKNQWTLMNKVLNPHQGNIQACLFIISQGDRHSQGQFITCSLTDPNVKVWKLKRQKRKSVLEIDEEFWNCQFEINYRNRIPLHVWVGQGQQLSVVYDQQVVIFDINSKTISHKYCIPNASKFFTLPNGSKLYQTDNIIHVQHLKVTKKKVKTAQKINEIEIRQIEFPSENIKCYPDFQNGRIAFECYNEDKNLVEILIYNLATQAVQHSFEIPQQDEDQEIHGVFWMQERLLVISHETTITDLTHGKEIFDSNRKIKHSQMSPVLQAQSAQTRDINLDLEAAEERWIAKESKRRVNITQDILGNMNTAPSFVTGFKLLSQNALL